jgi:hypothetical protein
MSEQSGGSNAGGNPAPMQADRFNNPRFLQKIVAAERLSVNAALNAKS